MQGWEFVNKLNEEFMALASMDGTVCTVSRLSFPICSWPPWSSDHPYNHGVVMEYWLCGSLHLCCMNIGTDHRVTSAYHSQSNGLCERLNWTVQNTLMKLVNDHQTTGMTSWIPPRLLLGPQGRGQQSTHLFSWCSTGTYIYTEDCRLVEDSCITVKKWSLSY